MGTNDVDAAAALIAEVEGVLARWGDAHMRQSKGHIRRLLDALKAKDDDLRALQQEWDALKAEDRSAAKSVGWMDSEGPVTVPSRGVGDQNNQSAPGTVVASERCGTCVHLSPLKGDVFTCPVVNIRLHHASIGEFGCIYHERDEAAKWRERDIVICGCGHERCAHEEGFGMSEAIVVTPHCRAKGCGCRTFTPLPAPPAEGTP